MALSLIIIIAILFPSPIIIWNFLKKYAINKTTKGQFIGWVVTSIIPIWNHSTLLYILFDYIDWSYDFKSELREFNDAYRCHECNITSRKYQFKGEHGNSCPHCGKSKYGSYSVDSNKEYPFAPKLKSLKFIKWKLEKNKISRIRKSMSETERIDTELQAYEQLQLKKLQELEAKANEIKAELAKGSVS